MTTVDKFAGLILDESLEGGFIIRGTEDLDLALQLYVDRARYGEVCLEAQRTWIEESPPASLPYIARTLAEDIAWAGYHLRRVRAEMRPGWYRKVHCLPGSYGDGEGWSWQLQELSDGDNRRGAFRAVVFYE